DHFDALDGIQRRYVGELATTKVVRVQVGYVALASAVDQHQRIFRWHAAHGDGGAAVLVGGFHADVDAFHVAQRVNQAGIRAQRQFFAADDADARRRIGDLLLEATGSDDHLVQRGRGA